jgi:predicted sugar kinase
MASLNDREQAQRFSRFRDGVTVCVPSRAAVSVFDMNMFARGRAGGGNSGVALSIYTKIKIRRRAGAGPGRDEWRAQYLLFDHCLSEWNTVIGDAGPFELEIPESPPPHVGLSSSAAFQAAVYAGLNWLDGLPLSEGQLHELMHSSYKEVEGGALVDGFATGLSGFLGFYGGFAAIDTDLRPLRHLLLPDWTFEVAVPRNGAKSNFGETEAQLLMGEGRRLDARDRDRKRQLIQEVLFPAAERRNLREFGRAIREIQSLGNKRAQIRGQGEHMDKALEGLWASGLECVFMSSLGPGIVVLSEQPLQALASTFDELSLVRMYSGKIDNRGIVMHAA